MVRPNAQHVRTAKANTDRWFTQTPMGTVFLPGDGRALRVSDEEAATIRADAEAEIVESGRQVERKVKLHIAALVIILMVVMSSTASLPSAWQPYVKYAPYALCTAHGLAVCHAFWRWERSIFQLRDTIAHSLRGRASLPPEIAGPLASSEPDYRMLGTVAFGLLAVMIVAETAPVWLEDLPQAEATQHIAHWAHAGAIGGIGALVFYILGVTALRRLANASAQKRMRR